MLNIEILNDTRLYPTVVNVKQDTNYVDTLIYTMSEYVVNEHDLSTYSWFAVMLGVNGLDVVELTKEVVEGKLKITFDLTNYVTRIGEVLHYQLVARDSVGVTWYSSQGIILNSESIRAEDYVVANYPSILKQWLDRMEGLKAETLEEINLIANDFGAAIIYIPYGEEIEDKIHNRLYYRWLDEENTIGQFEDHTGKVLTPDMIAENIGISAIAGVNGSNVQEALTSLQYNIDTKDYLPDQTGHRFKVLKTNGENAYWDYSAGGLPLLTCVWSDHFLKDVSYLRADTFSWHSGEIYVSAYDELVNEYDDVNSIEETEGDVTYKRTPSGYKICLPNQETNVSSIYNTTGVAWYYILDTTNKQFKLPRTKYGFTGLRNGVGDFVEAGLPSLSTSTNGNHTHTRGTMNITGSFGVNVNSSEDNVGASGAFSKTQSGNQGTDGDGASSTFITFNASNSWTGATSSNGNHTHTVSDNNGIVGNSSTVQPPATEMYLYFYVGNYVRSIKEIDAGKLSEVINDLDVNVISQEVNTIKTTAINEIENSKETTVQTIETTKTQSISEIETTKTNSISELETTKSTVISEIETAGEVISSYQTPLTTVVETTGEITLEVNKIYTMSITDTTTFVLPETVNTNYFNQIKVIASITGTPTINLGTTYYMNKTQPELEVGYYDIYFDYDNHLGGWVVGALSKGLAE